MLNQDHPLPAIPTDRGAIYAKIIVLYKQLKFTCSFYNVTCLRDLESFLLLLFLAGTEDFFKAARPGCMLNWKKVRSDITVSKT